MNVVHTKNNVTLLTRLKEEADTDTLKVEQTTHRKYELKEHMWFRIWRTVAQVSIYEQIVVVNEENWKKYGDVIKRLALAIEMYPNRISNVTIQVTS